MNTVSNLTHHTPIFCYCQTHNHFSPKVRAASCSFQVTIVMKHFIFKRIIYRSRKCLSPPELSNSSEAYFFPLNKASIIQVFDLLGGVYGWTHWSTWMPTETQEATSFKLNWRMQFIQTAKICYADRKLECRRPWEGSHLTFCLWAINQCCS